MYIYRSISKIIESGATQVPVIAIIGPRQSGKSTLAKEIFKNHKYVDMQDAQILDFANKDPKGFLNSYKNDHGLIIDEAQYAPKIFSQIKVEVDKGIKPGYYILSGSQNFLLHEKISESLAGRVYLYTLLPLSINELKESKFLEVKVGNQIFKGFYPKVYSPNINIYDYYKNYISTYVERDIRTLRNIENFLVFNKFMKLCALRIASVLNFSSLANECGISVNTVKSWISLLQTSFIIFLLPSYQDNLGKRIIKSPKLYFYDVGLACSLINIDKETLIENRSLYGSLFENMIIVDIIKNLNSQGFGYNINFFRDTNQNEIDLIIETKGNIIPIEIKASQTMNSHYFDTVSWFAQQEKTGINKDIIKKPVVIYSGDENQSRSNGRVLSWNNTIDIIT